MKNKQKGVAHGVLLIAGVLVLLGILALGSKKVPTGLKKKSTDYMGGKMENEPVEEPELEPTPNPVEEEPLTNMKTYKDESGGYQISYPNDWFADPPQEGFVGVTISIVENPQAPLAEWPMLRVHVNDELAEDMFTYVANEPGNAVLKTNFPEYNFEAVAYTSEVGENTDYLGTFGGDTFVITTIVPTMECCSYEVSEYDPVFYQILQTFRPL